MKLFKVEQPGKACYDQFQLMVCAAENEDVARLISPLYNSFINFFSESDSMLFWGCSLSELTVTYIGEAAEGIEQGVICADFNAE